ncbi:MAG: glycosyltransferase family 4 protein [Verrucomicrobiota bacterium]
MIYVVSQYYRPLTNPPAVRMGHLVHGLIERYGAENIRVITGRPNYPDGKLQPGFAGRAFRVTRGEHGETIHHLYEYATPFRGFYRKTWGLLTFAAGVFLYFIGRRLRPEDRIFVTFGPAFPAYVFSWLCRWKKHLRYTLDVRDLWPEVAAGMGYLKPDSFTYRILARLSSRAYREADGLLANSEGIQAYLKARPEGFDSVYLPNPVDTELFRPLDVPRDGEAFTVVFSGAFSHYTDLMTLIEAVAVVQGLRLKLVGEGEAQPELERFIQAHGLGDRVQIIPFVSDRTELVRIIRSADLCFASLRDSPYLHYATPTKILEYMACGMPVLALLNGPFAETLTRDQVALVQAPGKVDGLSHTLRRIMDQGFPDLRNPRSYIETHFSLGAFHRRLSDVLEGPMRPGPEASDSTRSATGAAPRPRG